MSGSVQLFFSFKCVPLWTLRAYKDFNIDLIRAIMRKRRALECCLKDIMLVH